MTVNPASASNVIAALAIVWCAFDAFTVDVVAAPCALAGRAARNPGAAASTAVTFDHTAAPPATLTSTEPPGPIGTPDRALVSRTRTGPWGTNNPSVESGADGPVK